MKRHLFIFISTLFNVVLHAQTITVNVISPTQGQVVVDSILQITATATSSLYEMSSVVASVGDRQISLGYNQTTSRFTGQIPLSGLPENETMNLQVVATDGGSNQQTTIVPFTYSYDPPPTILVDSPQFAGNANPLIRIKARCIDNDSCVLTVTVYSVDSYPVDIDTLDYGDPKLFSETFINSVDTTIDFSAGEGKLAFILFTATDSYGHVTKFGTYVTVESSPYLSKIFSGDGFLVDFNYNRVLTKRDSVGKITDILTGQSSIIPAAFPAFTQNYGQAGKHDVGAHYAFVTKYGAIFIDREGALKDWNNNQMYELSTPFSIDRRLQVAGEFACWWGVDIIDTRLRLRNLQQANNAIIRNAEASEAVDLASNGVIAYQEATSTSRSDILKYENGISTPIAYSSFDTISSGPVTDGTYIVFTKKEDRNDIYYLFLYDGTSQIEINNSGLTKPSYKVNQKWIAYTKMGPTGINQIWLRDSLGNQSQKTFFNLPSIIDKLDNKGNFTFFVQNTRYFADRESGQVIPVSSSLGQTYFRDSAWYLVLGSGLYKINIPGKPFISAADGYWDDPATWAGNIVPPSAANVEIKTNVICNINTTCYTLKVTAPGSLIVNSGIKLKVLH